MLLRRITEHVKAQNWFAVGIDFLIVVIGVFVGLQVQQWVVEQERQSSEHQYLDRLHVEVTNLIEERSIYDASRKLFSDELDEISTRLNETAEVTELTPLECTTIAHSAFTTIPPARLPTVTELLAAGRLDQLASPGIRDSILAFVQDADRARDLVTTISSSNLDLGRKYPELIKTRRTSENLFGTDNWLGAECNSSAIHQHAAFLNDLDYNAFNYIIYAKRGVFKVSQQLENLHAVLDKELGIEHADEGSE